LAQALSVLRSATSRHKTVYIPVHQSSQVGTLGKQHCRTTLLQRARHNFTRQNSEFANATVEEMGEIVRQGGQRFEAMKNTMIN
jgi:hypothetical protein